MAKKDREIPLRHIKLLYLFGFTYRELSELVRCDKTTIMRWTAGVRKTPKTTIQTKYQLLKPLLDDELIGGILGKDIDDI